MIQTIKTYLTNQAANTHEQKIIPKILTAIRTAERKIFVGNKNIAYMDTALPIEKEQTISQPSTVARMLQVAKIKRGENILEVGTGSGWNTCLLALLSETGTVLSFELHKELVQRAKQNIEALKEHLRNKGEENKEEMLKHIHIKHANIKELKTKNKVFDKILFTAGITSDEEELIQKIARNNLAENGTLICPLRRGPMLVYKHIDGEIHKTPTTKEEFMFVPLR